MTWGTISYIWFKATTAGRTITTASNAMSNVYFNPVLTGGVWALQDDFNSTGSDITHVYGTLNTNGKTVTARCFCSTGTGVRVLTLGASVINVEGNAGVGWQAVSTGLTVNANTSTIKLTGTGAFEGGSKTYNDVELNGTAHTISGDNTFDTLTLKDATTQTITFTDGSTQTFATGVLTGESGKVKTLVGTSTAGWTLVKTGGGAISVDYMALSYSEVGGNAGWWAGANSTDTAGNSGWTFTAPPAGRYWLGGTGNWSDDDNHWATTPDGATADGNVPSSSEDVYFFAGSFTAGSQTVTVDATAYCLGMDWTGATNTPTLSVGTEDLDYSGSLTLIAEMVCTSAVTGRINFAGTGSSLLTSNGLSIGARIVQTGTGTLTLAGALTMTNASTASFQKLAGTFTTNNFNMTLTGGIGLLGVGSCAVNLGSSTIQSSVWYMFASGCTFDSGTSTIKVTGTGQFYGYSQTYYNVELNGTAHLISGSNTFADLKLNRAGTQTITFTDGTTQTVTTFTRNVGTQVKTLVGSDTAGWAMVRSGVILVDVDYLDLSYSNVSPPRTWYAGTNSTDTVGNSGWTFTDPPRGGWLVTGTIHFQTAPGHYNDEKALFGL